MNHDLIAQLRTLEESLWISETRYDDAYVDSVFAPEFFEFGRSGKRYGRADLFMGDKMGQVIDVELPFPAFEVSEISDTVALVTYISKMRDGDELLCANRSSLWAYDGDTWQLKFHQGTPCECPD